MIFTLQNVNLAFKYYREGLIPGPQVPPRNPQETSPGSHGDRVLSVSGKKRCSHCKEELGNNIFVFGGYSIMRSYINYYLFLGTKTHINHIKLVNT